MLMFDLEDPRINEIADIISNKTSKKIVQVLSNQEMSESEIAKELNCPLNTVEYNLKKLKKAGLVEANSKLFWSSKGKRMHKYKLVDKKILISPKKSVKGILPVIAATALVALGINFIFERDIVESGDAELMVVERVSEDSTFIAGETAQTASSLLGSISLWFFVGSIVTVIFLLIYWRFKNGR